MLFCDPLTMTVAPYIRERCLKETEILYVWHICWIVGELGSGIGWRIPAIGNSNMSTNGSSSCNNIEKQILKTEIILTKTTTILLLNHNVLGQRWLNWHNTSSAQDSLIKILSYLELEKGTNFPRDTRVFCFAWAFLFVSCPPPPNGRIFCNYVVTIKPGNFPYLSMQTYKQVNICKTS